jgi:hypothetical protein
VPFEIWGQPDIWPAAVHNQQDGGAGEFTFGLPEFIGGHPEFTGGHPEFTDGHPELSAI